MTGYVSVPELLNGRGAATRGVCARATGDHAPANRRFLYAPDITIGRLDLWICTVKFFENFYFFIIPLLVYNTVLFPIVVN